MADLSLILQDDSVKSRFWAKVDVRGPDECWLWQASRNHNGYGHFSVNKLYIAAHRFALMIQERRLLSSAEFACHTCDNPPCVNPRHLYVGDRASNIADMHARNRFSRWRGARRGDSNPKAKLSSDDIKVIRRLSETMSKSEIARHFGVSWGTINSIIFRKTWGHV